MTPSRWRQVEELYHAVSKRDAVERDAFLREACEGDEELKGEVESLLRQEASGEGLLAWDPAQDSLREPSARLKPGDELGPYRIVSLIGSGGMGQVYKAHDPRVGRDVAIKVSQARFTGRFEREARAVGALNHPNICHLYDVGPNYLVMELVEGPTLADRIQRGAIPLQEALGIASQVADAFDAAHSRGIVHRDLKPANLKLTADGAVKVLDFGLAKAIAAPTPSGASPPTETMEPPTQAGMILGTAAYMSPEQAQGRPVDKRTDIWAFGVVLYEMVTGRRLFHGRTLTETLAAVLKDEPNLDLVPQPIRRLLQRCLEKDPKKRLRDIADGLPLVEAPEISTRRGRPLSWVLLSAAIAVLAVLSFVHFRERPREVEPMRFHIAMPENTVPTPLGALTVSPDGRKVAFAALSNGVVQLWVRSLDSVEARPLPGSSIGVGMPFWSPDSRYVAFGAAGRLHKIDVAGGPPETICELPGTFAGGSWNRDGVILLGFGLGSGSGPAGIIRVSAVGSTPRPVTIPPSPARDIYPTFLEDGKHFIYLRISGSPEKNGVYLGSLDAKPAEQSSKLLLPTNASAGYVPPTDSARGRLLFLREGSLFAQNLDPGAPALTGDPFLVADQVGMYPAAFYARFSASTNGVLVYRPGSTTQLRQLTWFDRRGRILGSPGEPSPYGTLKLSPDGTRAAIVKYEANPDIWIVDLVKGTENRLTFGPAVNSQPVWSPDGTQIAFRSDRGGSWGVYRKAANGAGSEELIAKIDREPDLTDWSRDGRFLLYHAPDEKMSFDVWALPLDGDRKPFPVFHGKANEIGGYFSPDNRWIAYRSNESGRNEIYVQAFNSKGSEPGADGGKWMVSKGSAGMARWRHDGKELVYLSNDAGVMSVAVSANPAFQPGRPELLFRLPPAFSFTSPTGTIADATSDNQKFLVAMPVSRDTPNEFTVVLNWQAALKR